MQGRMLAVLLLLGAALSSYATNKPNIILITFDGARSDSMGFLGAKSAKTPNLDRLAAQSMIFEKAFAQAPTTVVSHTTILSGTYPQTHQASEFGAPLPTSLPFLPDLLRARGYHTAAFVGSTNLDPANGYAPGFERGFMTYDAGTHLPEQGRGESTVARATAWLQHNSQDPFFLWLNLSGSQPDVAIGQLLSTLRTQKLFDDALIMVTSAYGESRGAHGEATHGIFLYNETLHVPLLVKLPQNRQQRVHAKVPLVDVAPTILEVAGVPVPSQMQGQSLLRIAKTGADQSIYSRSDYPAQAFGLAPLESWRAGKYLYIRAPNPELYDLSADPSASHNLAQTSKATLATIASQLTTFDQHFSGTGSSTQLTSSQMQKLASLGYVGVQKPANSNDAVVHGTDPKEQTAIINRILAAERSLANGNPVSATATLQPLMVNASAMYLAQYMMGVALAQQKKYVQAIPYLHRAIELQPDSTHAHYEMGSALIKTGDYKTAAVHLEIATMRQPNFATAHLLLSQAYEHLGRADEAKREKTRADELVVK
jgi:choline-sulfatase